MTSQLRLLDPVDVDWKLDERTKEIGRRGLAQARAALRANAPIEAEADRAAAA
jgi:hypothetical protein